MAKGDTATRDLPGRIRALRHAANLTTEQAAHAVAVHEPSWRRWERGSRTPAPEYWPAIAKALSVPLDALFAPEGWAVLPTPWLRPESLLELQTPEGRKRLEQAVCARMIEALAQAKPLLPAPPGRRRRTREQVLAAQSERLKVLSRETASKRKRKASGELR